MPLNDPLSDAVNQSLDAWKHGANFLGMLHDKGYVVIRDRDAELLTKLSDWLINLGNRHQASNGR